MRNGPRKSGIARLQTNNNMQTMGCVFTNIYIYIYIYIYTCTNDATGCYTQTTRQKIPRTHMCVMNIHALQRAVQALSDSTRHNKEWPMLATIKSKARINKYEPIDSSMTCRTIILCVINEIRRPLLGVERVGAPLLNLISTDDLNS